MNVIDHLTAQHRLSDVWGDIIDLDTAGGEGTAGGRRVWGGIVNRRALLSLGAAAAAVALTGCGSETAVDMSGTITNKEDARYGIDYTGLTWQIAVNNYWVPVTEDTYNQFDVGNHVRIHGVPGNVFQVELA